MGSNGAKVIPRWIAMFAILFMATTTQAQEFAPDNGPQPDGSLQSWGLGWGEYVPRGGIGYQTGRGIGYPRGYGSVEGLVPLVEAPGQLLLFSDLRLLIDDDGHTGSNLGFGYRYYAAELNRTFGAVVYYDLRETDENTFEQLTVSFDTLGRWWDLRTNVYAPSIFSDRRIDPAHFAGNYLFLDGVETALSGADLEVSMPLPSWWIVEPRVGAGFYHFQGPDVPDLWGWKARAEARVSENIVLNLAVHHDEQFDTTVNFGLTCWFPNTWSQRPGARAGRREPAQRLGEPVERLENIAVVSRSSELARDPQTGEPLVFLHVGAETAGADGTFEAPYRGLTDALNDPRCRSAAVDMVYVHSDRESPLSHASNASPLPPDGETNRPAHTGDLTLVPGVQLRSNGPTQWVTTQQGTVRLPFSGTDPELLWLPQIDGHVYLADNTYLSGFDISGGVSGSEVSNITVAENRITSLGNIPMGVNLDRVAGSATIRNNVVSNCINQDMGYGIFVGQSRGAAVTIAGNTVHHCAAGILFFGGEVTADVAGNTIYSNNIGLAIQNGAWLPDGLCISVPPLFFGTITDNQIRDNARSGISLQSANFTGTIDHNRISGNGLFGIEGSFYEGRFNGAITENLITKNPGVGIGFTFATVKHDFTLDSGNGDHRMAVLNNRFAGNGEGLPARDVSIVQACGFGDYMDHCRALYLEFDGNVSADCPVLSGGSNYLFVQSRPPLHWSPFYSDWSEFEWTDEPYVPYAQSSPGEFFLHLGENVGTVGVPLSGVAPQPWSDWPNWPE